MLFWRQGRDDLSESVRAGLEFWLCHPLGDFEHGIEAQGSQVSPLFKKRRT